MKKIALLTAAAVLLSLLAACGAPDTGGKSIDDDTPFDWPENTQVPQKNDSLTIYTSDLSSGKRMLENAAVLFRAAYPGITIEVIAEPFDEENFFDNYQKVATEIMAGSGPDILMINDLVLDVEKMVRQGAFADMEPFFDADGFDWEPYNQTVMDGGVWDGRRYVVPMSYDFPLLVTTRTALEETGFDMDACKDYNGFLEETRRFMEDDSQTRSLLFLTTSYLVSNYLMDFSGVRYANFNNQTVDLSAPELRATCEWMRLHEEKYAPEIMGLGGGLWEAEAVRDGEALWEADSSAATNFFYQFAALKTVDEAVMMPIRDVNGGIQAHLEYLMAVRANSENLQNAYNYLKILLSLDVQGSAAGMYNGEALSVLDEANINYYHKPTYGKEGDWASLSAGSYGFTSTVDSLHATDWPTEEEFEQFLAISREISGTYFHTNLGLQGAMSPFLRECADFDETLREAQNKLEIRISE